MSRMYGNMDMAAMFKEEKTLVINRNNKIIKNILTMENEDNKNLICHEIFDFTWLSGGKPTTLNNLFKSCSSLESVDLSPLNTENVYDICSTFAQCLSLKEINLKQIHTEKISNLRDAFWDCRSLTNLISDGLNWGKVKNMWERLLIRR